MNRLALAAALTAAAVCLSCASSPFGVRPVIDQVNDGKEGRGRITITFEIIDEDLTWPSVAIEYFKQNAWREATLTDATVGAAVAAFDANVMRVKEWVGDWTPCTLTWDSLADGVALDGSQTVTIRLTPRDLDGAGEPVEHELAVNNLFPTLGVTTSLLTFQHAHGGANPASQTVWIENSGPDATTLVWSADTGALPAWLSMNPANGTLDYGDPATAVAFSVDPAGESLDVGTYDADVTITGADTLGAEAHGSPFTVHVTLTVREFLTVIFLHNGDGITQITELPEFVMTEGGANPVPKSFWVMNAGDEGSVLEWAAVDDLSDPDWMYGFETDPVGDLQAGESAEVVVNIEGSHLIAGTYHGTIVVSETGTTGGGVAVSVCLTVRSQEAVSYVELGAGLVPVSDCALGWCDYDRDGKLDLAIAGRGGDSGVSILYHNTGAGLADAQAGLTGFVWRGLAWGDYNRDGWVDLLVGGGYDALGAMPTELYLNTVPSGPDEFELRSPGIPDCSTCRLASADCDNDGDVDLAFMGNVPDGEATRVYHNDGTAAFHEAWVEPVHFSGGNVAWGDYDNDGDLDLARSGIHYFGPTEWTSETQLFRNDGGALTKLETPVALLWGAAEWGDYDCDGDLDLAVAGSATAGMSSAGGLYTVVLENEGGGSFRDIGAAMHGVKRCRLAWGDCDNDGDLDLVVAGQRSDNDSRTTLYRNDNGVFLEVSTGFANVCSCSLAWGDCDGDGDLDLALAGMQRIDGNTSEVSEVYLCQAGTPNAPPSAPTDLQASSGSGEAAFSWLPAADSETPAAGLTYNLRVGTAPGADDVMPGMSIIGGATDGRRLVAAMGNVQHAGPASSARRSWTLWLPDGTYYWSVQAVDNSFAGSPWAPERVLEVGAPPGSVTIDTFTATPGSISSGGSSTLAWATSNATSCSIDNGIGAVTTGGSATVSPVATTTFTLTADGPYGPVTAQATVTVGTGGGPVTVPFRMNCGPSAQDSGWASDDAYVSGGTDFLFGGGVDKSAVTDPAPDGVYLSVRHADPAFDVPIANGSYTVRLHFFDGYGDDSVDGRAMNVTIEGVEVLSGYSIKAAAGGTSKATVEEFDVSVGDGSLTIVLDRASGNDAFVSGVEVLEPGVPQDVSIDSFAAAPDTITAGQSSTLSWTTSWATSVSLDQGIGAVAADGSTVVSPSSTTVYTLTAEGLGGPVTAQATVTVGAAVPQPAIALSLTSLSFDADEGGPNPPDQTAQLGNSGDGGTVLEWTATADTPWLSVQPGSGTTTTEVDALAVSVDVTGLAPGTHSGCVTVSDPEASNDPQLVAVTLELAPLPRFTNIDAGLVGLMAPAAAWGDWDGDGDLDLVTSGCTEWSVDHRRSIQYENDGMGGFSIVSEVLPKVARCAVAWGDLENDGDIDLAIAGSEGSHTFHDCISQVWANDGAGNLTFSGNSFGANRQPALAWGDFNNDGRQDLVVFGEREFHDPVNKLYNNLGGTFADSGALFPVMWEAQVVPGDCDNDGDLDLYMGDWDNAEVLYKNLGGGVFGQPTALPGNEECRAEWADIDNDGDLDFSAGGRLYVNDGTGTFAQSGTLTLAYGAHSKWGDYNNDGNVDVVTVDRVHWGDGAGGFTEEAIALFHDSDFHDGGIECGDYDNDGDLDLVVLGCYGSPFAAVFRNNCATPNARPDAPGGLSPSVAGADVTLNWSPSTDDHTPPLGLSYNLRVGTTQGGNDIVSGMARPDGRRLIPALGNAQKRLSWTLKGLAPGTYHWSVQAIDTSFLGGSWAGEADFTIQ